MSLILGLDSRMEPQGQENTVIPREFVLKNLQFS